MDKLNRVFGTVTLLMAILIVWHWALLDVGMQSPAIWLIVDTLFIVLPIIYLLGYGYLKGRKFNAKNLDPLVLTLLLIICVVAIYQLVMGKFAMESLVWNYLDAFSVVAYSFIAGKYLFK